MKEGKGQMSSYKGSHTKLDIIVEKLLNNEEFLNKMAKRIFVKYSENKKNYSETQIFSNNNIEGQNKVYSENAITSYYNEQYLEKSKKRYIDEINEKDKKIDSLNIEKIQNEKMINELICEKNTLEENINLLKKNIEEIKKENEKLIGLKNIKEEKIITLQKEQNTVKSDLYELRKENEVLKQNFEILKNKCSETELNMKQSLNTKDKELYKMEKELREKDMVILQQKSEMNDLKSEFSSIKKSYNIFLSLSDEVKEDMVSILKGDKIENFIYAGVQYKNIESIWEYAKNRAVNGQFEDLHKLEKIIMNFLEAYNMLYSSPLYKVQSVENGDDFDEEKFIRGYESRITGNISNVDLKGYVNLVNGKIIKKSVVRIYK